MPGGPLVFAGGAGVAILALAYLVYGGVQQGATYWVTVGELRQRTGSLPSRVRLGGTVVSGSIRWDAAHQAVRFVLTDGPPDPRVYRLDGGTARGIARPAVRGQARGLPVVYSGVVPDIFGAGRQVVVEGTLGRDGTFEATTLLAKCSTRYASGDARFVERQL